jgi:hypothetical protein
MAKSRAFPSNNTPVSQPLPVPTTIIFEGLDPASKQKNDARFRRLRVLDEAKVQKIIIINSNFTQHPLKILGPNLQQS